MWVKEELKMVEAFVDWLGSVKKKYPKAISADPTEGFWGTLGGKMKMLLIH